MDMLAPFLGCGESSKALNGDLARQATHILEERDVVRRLEGKHDVDLQVTPSIAGPPGLDVVVVPYQGVHNVEEVGYDGVEAEDNGGKLPVPPQKPCWHDGDEYGYDAEGYTEEEVDLERRVGMRGSGAQTNFRRRGPGKLTALQVEGC